MIINLIATQMTKIHFFLFFVHILYVKTHLPGYIEKAAEIKAGGVDEIVCVSVNDAFVMSAWGKAHETGKFDLFMQ